MRNTRKQMKDWKHEKDKLTVKEGKTKYSHKKKTIETQVSHIRVGQASHRQLGMACDLKRGEAVVTKIKQEHQET